MRKRVIILFLLAALSIDFTLGLEHSRQQPRYNPNTDFLLHEGGVYTNGAKKDVLNTQISVAPTQQNNNKNNEKRDYVAQFPPLKPPSTTKPTTVGSNNNNPSSERRDYVAPFPQSPSPVTPKSPTTAPLSTHTQPSLKPIQGANITPKSPTTATINEGSDGKRNYVAPQYPTLKPAYGSSQPGNGKVKDLINYFDQNGNGNGPQKIPSYSSILSGSTTKNNPGSTSATSWFTQTTPKPGSVPTKPLSFSNVVSGSKGPNAQVTVTTLKPSTKFPSNSYSRPGSPVLPSTIVNTNNNNQGNNNAPTDLELQTLSEELLRKDVNNAAKYVTINYQEKTTSRDTADKTPNPLLAISPEAWNIPTIQKLVPLLDNYERDTLINEYVTPLEKNEENAFMDAIMSTAVIRHLMNFLKDKGYVTPDPRQQRDFLKQLWFNLYSRGKGKISSSGFEHVFVSEIKNSEVLGLHNWIYFAKEEAANRINYLGYLKYVQLNDKGAVLKLHFNQQNVDKPVGSMFIGTSPELEIALYTLCFVTRADNDCKLKLANNDIDIVTHTFRYRSKNCIGSAFPQIPTNWS